MPSYELEGQIDSIEDTVTFDSGFSKREFVVETVSEKYPQFVKLQVVKDKCDGLDEYQSGDMVKVKFNLSGRKGKEGTAYEGKVFNNNECWALDKVAVSQDILDAADKAQDALADEDDKNKLPF